MSRFPVSVKAVLVDPAQRVVLLENERGEWELPGGKLEGGEHSAVGRFTAAEMETLPMPDGYRASVRSALERSGIPNAGAEIAEKIRSSCLEAATRAYDDAGVQGLCAEGRWEAAIGAIRALDIERLATGAEGAPRR